MNKDLLRMDNLSKEEILDILNLADQLKYERKQSLRFGNDAHKPGDHESGNSQRAKHVGECSVQPYRYLLYR